MRAFRQKEASPQALRWGWMLTEFRVVEQSKVA